MIKSICNRLDVFFYYSLQRLTSNGNIHNKYLPTVDENSNILTSSTQKQNPNDTKNGSETTFSNTYDQYIKPSSCIIKIESLSDDNENNLINGDSIQQITMNDIDLTIINQNSSSIIRPTQLDAIVEDSNEENSDDHDESMQSIR